MDVHLEARSIDVANQIVQHGWETAMSAPKTDSSESTVALDEDTALVLTGHLHRRDAEK